MDESNTLICSNFQTELSQAIGNVESESIFILTDTTTQLLCLPALLGLDILKNSHQISIAAGDEHKNIQSAIQIWQYLSENGATRQSLMINVGGGVVTDIGGFVASTFKRGINYINVSTTVLGAVDAATGGKTGINFGGLKNEIGSFAPAKAVLIHTDFFKTLDHANILSGYAEMLKHALIDTRQEWDELLKFDLGQINFDMLSSLVSRSIVIKERIVEQDPTEQSIRKALNLGHTFGHAFESMSYKQNRPVLHGYAVMWGLICELYMSHVKLEFPLSDLLRLQQLTIVHYGRFVIEAKDYETLYELMTHDKKNDAGGINFTLLSGIGQVQINQTASKEEIFECFDYFAGV